MDLKGGPRTLQEPHKDQNCKRKLSGTIIAKISYAQGSKIVILLGTGTNNVTRTFNKDQIRKRIFWDRI